MVLTVPPSLNTESMTAEGDLDNAIAKVDEFFHRRYNLPVNWLVCVKSLERYGRQLREWKDKYGDEIGIYEFGFVKENHLVAGVQSWMKEAGVEHPAADGGHVIASWSDMSEDDQVRIISYLKTRFDRELDQDTKVMFAANGDASTVRAMKKCGIEIMWGYNWDLYGDLVDATGKGSLPYPFYVSSVHAKAAAEPGDTRVLGVQWGSGDLLNVYCSARQAKIAMNNVCLNAHELANRSGAVPEHEYVERVFERLTAQAANNPFIYIPLQIEANWIDEGGVFYGQHPDFPARTTEVFYHEIETALRHGARIVTHTTFLKWYREHFDRTPEMTLYYDDPIPGVTFRGKDHDYPPMLLYGDYERQMIFLKAAGMNPVRMYKYDPPVPNEDSSMEYAYSLEPDVELKVKGWTTPSFGIEVSKDGIVWRASQFELTAARDYPDYACVIWDFHLPEYVLTENLQCSANIKRIKLLRDKNIAIVFVDLKKGDNTLRIESPEPARYIKIEKARFTGRRYEVYIHNDGPPVGLSSLSVMLEPNLQLGGFWWDGKYYQSLFHFHYSPYNWNTGEVLLRTAYPETLSLRTGQTRLSFEVFGHLPQK